MPDQAFDGFWMKIKGRGAVNPAEFFIELKDEISDLVSSLPQGWHFHSDDIESIQQVFAE